MKKDKLRALLLFVDDAARSDTNWQVYHENSKIGRLAVQVQAKIGENEDIHASLLAAIGNQRGRYPYHPKYPLDVADDNSRPGLTLRQALAKRRSKRKRHNAPLPFQRVSELLFHATRSTGRIAITPTDHISVKCYPSAGSLYPVQTYLLVRDVDGMKPGFYYLDTDQTLLCRLSSLPDSHDWNTTFIHDRHAADAPLTIFMTAIVNRTSMKYGERAYRYCLLEAGHLSQNYLLLAEELGLHACPIGGFVERDVENLLDIDGIEEIAIYALTVGMAAEDEGSDGPS